MLRLSGAARFLVVSSGIMAVLSLSACSSTTNPLTDPDVVFCLSDAQRPNLADAAVTLGLADDGGSAESVQFDGQTTDVRMWRKARPREFERACAALRPTRPAASPTFVQTGLFATGNVIVGALLGFVFTRWRDVVQRGDQASRALRGAMNAYVTSGRAYVRDWDDEISNNRNPSNQAMFNRQGELRVELRRVEASYPKSSATALISRLGVELGEDAFRDWRARDSRRQGVRIALDEIERDVTVLAGALEHPVRRRSVLKGRDETGQVAAEE